MLPTDAQRIYQVLFPGDIPPELERRFVSAWEIMSPDYSQEEYAEFHHALAHV